MLINISIKYNVCFIFLMQRYSKKNYYASILQKSCIILFYTFYGFISFIYMCQTALRPCRMYARAHVYTCIYTYISKVFHYLRFKVLFSRFYGVSPYQIGKYTK